MQNINIEPSIGYEEARGRKIEEATAVKIYCFPISPAQGGGDLLSRFLRFLTCLCVQDRPDNPCPCGGPIIWIPREKILMVEKSDRKNHDGQKLALVTVAKDAQIVVERLSTVTAGAFMRLSDPRPGRPSRGAMAMNAGGFGTPVSPMNLAGLLVTGAFTAGYAAGKWADGQFGVSDAAAEAWYDALGPAPGWLQDLF